VAPGHRAEGAANPPRSSAKTADRRSAPPDLLGSTGSTLPAKAMPVRSLGDRDRDRAAQGAVTAQVPYAVPAPPAGTLKKSSAPSLFAPPKPLAGSFAALNCVAFLLRSNKRRNSRGRRDLLQGSAGRWIAGFDADDVFFVGRRREWLDEGGRPAAGRDDADLSKTGAREGRSGRTALSRPTWPSQRRDS
jgi:hypothetical protein